MNASADLFPSYPRPSAEQVTKVSMRPVLVRFDVFGDPAPQGSKKFVGFTKPKPGETRGRAILAEDVGRVKPWRQDVGDAGRLVMAGREPFDGALVMSMVFTLRKPMSAPKRRQSWPNTKPDVSKLCRATEDALMIAGVIRDDARIVGYDKLFKVYPGEDPDALTSPGVRIEIRRLG